MWFAKGYSEKRTLSSRVGSNPQSLLYLEKQVSYNTYLCTIMKSCNHKNAYQLLALF